MSNHIFDAGHRFYNSAKAVSAYSAGGGLQKPEVAIYNALKPHLGGMDMLDLGVGAGRTAPHFTPIVRRYVGSDFSPNMIAECNRKFPHQEFVLADATELTMFPDASFDFILFSFNGLDCMYTESRAKALGELFRLVRPGGYLAFSSHNLQYIPRFRTITALFSPFQPKRVWDGIKHLAKFSIRTRSVVLAADQNSALVKEHHLGFDIPVFFIKPETQIATLKTFGWQEIRIFGSADGREIVLGNEVSRATDPWLYYFCRKAVEK